jgi:hypothetical protein
LKEGGPVAERQRREDAQHKIKKKDVAFDIKAAQTLPV